MQKSLNFSSFLTCEMFEDTFSYRDSITTTECWIYELEIVLKVAIVAHWLYCPIIYIAEIINSTKNHSQVYWCPGQDSKYTIFFYFIWRKTNLMYNLSPVYFAKHFYMFRAYLQPIIRRYTLWKQQLVIIVLVRWLPLVMVGIRDSHLKRTINSNCCIHTMYLLMMDYRYARNM